MEKTMTVYHDRGGALAMSSFRPSDFLVIKVKSHSETEPHTEGFLVTALLRDGASFDFFCADEDPSNKLADFLTGKESCEFDNLLDLTHRPSKPKSPK